MCAGVCVCMCKGEGSVHWDVWHRFNNGFLLVSSYFEVMVINCGKIFLQRFFCPSKVFS